MQYLHAKSRQQWDKFVVIFWKKLASNSYCRDDSNSIAFVFFIFNEVAQRFYSRLVISTSLRLQFELHVILAALLHLYHINDRVPLT